MPDTITTPCCWTPEDTRPDTCCLTPSPGGTGNGPQRIRWIRFDGKPLPAGAKLITRGNSPYGNPYTVKEYGQHRAVALFAVFLGHRRNPPAGWVNPFPTYPSDDQIRADLHGHDLACVCRADVPCHGDILLPIANPGVAR